MVSTYQVADAQKFLKVFGELFVLFIYWLGGHLGHVTNIIQMHFHFLVPKSLHTKFGENGSVVSEKC